MILLLIMITLIPFTQIKNEPAVNEISEAINDGSVVFISASKTTDSNTELIYL